MSKNLKVEYKSTPLISILSLTLAGKMNLARIKFFGLFICALCKVQSVCFEKLATAFETDAKLASSLRRIQRFMAGYALDTDLIACVIFKMLPHKSPYRLAMDRTNRKYNFVEYASLVGQTNINVLTLAVVYQGVAFPLLISMFDKFGHSHTQECIAMIERYIRLFGHETIDSLIADREFAGKNRISYLNDRQLRYYVRSERVFTSIILVSADE